MDNQYPSALGVSAPAAEIGLDVQAASPPTQAYVGKDDSLWVMAAYQNSGLVVTVNFRLLMPDGTIQLNQQALRFAPSRLGTYQQIALPECFLLSVGATTNSAGSSIGQPFVTISLSRLSPSLFNAAQQLCGGYCQANQPVTWPGGLNTTSVDCAGQPLVGSASAPAAGANFSLTVPSNAKWRPISLTFTLTTSATVINRNMVLLMDDGLNVFSTIAVATSQAAGLTWSYTFNQQDLASGGIGNAIQWPAFAGVFLMGGYRLRSNVSNLQVGDQISTVLILVEEWLLP